MRNPYCGVNVGLKSAHTLFNQIGKTPNGPCVIESSSEPRYLSRPYHDLFVMEVPRWSFVDGKELTSRLSRKKRLTRRSMLPICYQLSVEGLGLICGGSARFSCLASPVRGCFQKAGISMMAPFWPASTVAALRTPGLENLAGNPPDPGTLQIVGTWVK